MAEIAFLQQIFLALFVGALLGLEREYTKKQTFIGVRTFAMASLLGTLAVLIGDQLAIGYLTVAIGFGIIGFFALLFYVNTLVKHEIRGFTTNFALILAYLLGVFVGFNLFVEAVFLSIIIAIIMFSRERLHSVVAHMTQKEVGDLMEFLILLGIIYPLVPETIHIFGFELPLLMMWYLIVFISLINFASFLASRYVGAKEEFWAISFLGGLVSRTATLLSLINISKKSAKARKLLVPSHVIMMGSELIRNFGIILITVPATIGYLLPILVVGAGSLLMFGYSLMKKKKGVQILKVSSPFNVLSAVRLGFIFFLLYIIMLQAQLIGTEYFALAAILGGAVSTTAVTISFIALLLNGAISIQSLALGVILAAIGSSIADYVYSYVSKTPQVIGSAKYAAVSIVLMLAVLFYLGQA
jgi:uncharacterized membrane protein (DUF4010 family)